MDTETLLTDLMLRLNEAHKMLHNTEREATETREAYHAIAAGRYDGIALPATQEKMAARIPGAMLRFFEGGHVFMLQDATANPAMAAFLAGA